MTNEHDQIACTRNCWLMGVVAGLVFAAVLYVVVGLGTMQAVFVGVLVAAILGLLLGTLVCSGSRARPAAEALRPGGAGTAAVAAHADAGTSPVASPATAPVASPATAPVSAPATAPASTTKSSFVSEVPAAKPAETPAVTPADPPAPAAPDTTAAPAATETAPVNKPVAADGKPELLTAARPGGADDLKLISGVGPKLEQTLNDLGVYHFDQVASWRKKEIEWVDSQLRFKGRIERDGWIAQAKTLAAGGETEFSVRKKKT